MKADTFTSKLVSKEYLSKDIIRLVFQAPEIGFKAGQFVQILFEPDKEDSYRDYSLLNPPSSNTMELCLKIIPGGYSSEIFRNAKEGQEFIMKGPLGTFILDESAREHVFIAGGTGIVPIYSMLMEHAEANPNMNFTLLYSAPDIDELTFHDIFLDMRFRLKNFNYHPMLTQDMTGWHGLEGRFQDNIDKLLDYKNKTFYICGLKDFVKDAVVWLRNKKVDNKDILFERYD